MASLFSCTSLIPCLSPWLLVNNQLVFKTLPPHSLSAVQPGFGFVTFDDDRDADDAVANLDGKNGWKVERARPGRRDGGGGGGYGGGGYGGGGGGYGGGGYGGGGDRYGGGGGDRYGGGGGGYGDRPAFGSSKCYACGEVGRAREAFVCGARLCLGLLSDADSCVRSPVASHRNQPVHPCRWATLRASAPPTPAVAAAVAAGAALTTTTAAAGTTGATTVTGEGGCSAC